MDRRYQAQTRRTDRAIARDGSFDAQAARTKASTLAALARHSTRALVPVRKPEDMALVQAGEHTSRVYAEARASLYDN
ncbi:hypothetical protein FJZ19_04915 [Candidatus Pacearchaeota archaeon]|nr:hypothetical protein [Candidatus Pacearchaeota archaeon]